MSYTQSFVGETEFDRQALNLDKGQAGVPLWKIYDPRSVGLPSNLRYDLSGLGGSPAWSDPKPTAVAKAKMALAQAQAELNLNPTNGQLVAKVVARADELRAVLEKESKTSGGPAAPPPSARGGVPKWALLLVAAFSLVVANYLFLENS